MKVLKFTSEGKPCPASVDSPVPRTNKKRNGWTSDVAARRRSLRNRIHSRCQTIDAAVREGLVTFSVASGEQFVPRLFAELTQQIRSVSVARPTLDDVFMSYTGRTIRDTEATAVDKNRGMMMAMRRGR